MAKDRNPFDWKKLQDAFRVQNRRRVSIRDIAVAVGCSTGYVKQILNGNKFY